MQILRCDAVTSSHTRDAGGVGPPSVESRHWPRLPAHATGGLLVDGAGLLVGIVSRAATSVPASLTEILLKESRHGLAAEKVTAGKGFPWKWVTAGAAAVGLTVAFTRGGSGDNRGSIATRIKD